MGVKGSGKVEKELVLNVVSHPVKDWRKSGNLRSLYVRLPLF